MRLTKFDHSCFALEKSGHTIIFDPVEYGFSLPDFPILDAIIITHSHPDHCQPQVIQKLSSRHPQAPIFTTQDNLAKIPSAQIFPSAPFKVGDFELAQYGDGKHSPVVPGQPSPCQNLAITVDRLFANPADSYNAPDFSPKILAIALAAPWASMSAIADLITATKPDLVIPCHEAVLSEMGQGFYESCLAQISHNCGADFLALHSGKSMEI